MDLAPHEQEQLVQIAAWQEDLAALHDRIAPRFVRPEVRARAGRYLAGLLGRCRTAQWVAAGGSTRGAQPGRGAAVAAHRALGCRRGARRPAHLRGGAPGRSGGGAGHRRDRLSQERDASRSGWRASTRGRRDGSRTARSGSSSPMPVLAGRPSWTARCICPRSGPQDAARREDAGVPPEIRFATKGELARAMLARAFAAQVPAAWVTGDEVYGNDGALRRWLEAEARPYVLAVACSHRVWQAGAQMRVDALVATIPSTGWQRIDVGRGQQRSSPLRLGPRPVALSDRGGLGAVAARPPLGRQAAGTGLLSRLWSRRDRHRGTGAGGRHALGRSRKGSSERRERSGLDQYEVRRWDAWHRHITLCLLAHAFLEVTRTAAHAGAKRGATTMS